MAAEIEGQLLYSKLVSCYRPLTSSLWDLVTLGLIGAQGFAESSAHDSLRRISLENMS